MTRQPEIMLPLKIATQRASKELEGLHMRLERFEHGLDTVFAHSATALDTHSIAMLQELDMLRQSVGALAHYLAHITALPEKDGMVDVAHALHAVPLRDMAMRLGGENKSTTGAGHAELF